MLTVPRWLPRHRQLDVVSQVAWRLGANANGAKLCYFGASVNGASVNDAKCWIHFLNKGAKKKDGRRDD
jgi:hypothetical protein